MSLKKNVLYSGVLTTSLYIFQFITYPYVARILGVTNIGICNFAQSIVQYFVLFASLGTMSLGVREIAKCGNDKSRLNTIFSEITCINVAFTLCVLLVYFLSINIVPQLIPYKKLLYVGAIQLVSSVFTFEWLFRGLEDFKYITIRNLIVRLLYVISIFVFIRNREDYNLYFYLTVGLYFSNSLINFYYLRNFVRFNFVPLKNAFAKLFKPMCLLGVQSILTTMYTSFNVVFLGFVSGDEQVGYYTTATKIQGIILSLFSAFTLVLMPRMSALIESKEIEKVKALFQSSLSVLYAFSFPIIVLVIVLSPQIIEIIAGNEYNASVLLLRLAIPLILIIGLEQVVIVQLLIPMGQDKYSFVSYSFGALAGVIMNIVFVPYLASLGSVIVWFVSELIVLAFSSYFVNCKLPIAKEICRMAILYCLVFTPLLFILLPMSENISIVVIVTVVYTHLALCYLLKNNIYIQNFSKLFHSTLKIF